MIRFIVKQILTFWLAGVLLILITNNISSLFSGGKWNGMAILNWYYIYESDGVRNDITLVDLDYRLHTVVVPDFFAPDVLSWSADYKNLYFIGTQEHRRNIYVLNPETRQIEPLKTEGFVTGFKFSPNGRMIAYNAEIGNAPLTDSLYFIHILDLETYQIKPVVEQRSDRVSFLAWSPDETKIAFVSHNSQTLLANIFTKDLYTGEITPLTNTNFLYGYPDGLAGLSPDWKTLLYIAEEGNSMYNMNVLSGEINRLSDHVHIASPRLPTYSPDGTKIAFINRTGLSPLYLMSSDGTDLRALSMTQNVEVFHWSNRGEAIYYTNGKEVFVVNIKDDSVSQLLPQISEKIADFQMHPR